MMVENRKIMMLVDNAPPHKPDDGTVLSKVVVKMLLPNTKEYLQLQDAGIIVSFEAKIKQRHLQNALDLIDLVMSGRQDNDRDELLESY
ncbi:hypothetical protein AaE_013959, partial [Aphanomyces astaci]